MAPVIRAAQDSGAFDMRVCVTAQHRKMLDQVLSFFGIRPEYDLDLMQPNQSLSDLTRAALSGIDDVLGAFKPSLVLVHGDTTTTLSASLAAYYHRIPVAHVEAGLRTGDVYSPWPEEVNRRIAGVISTYHFAPTERARNNLLAEGVLAESIWVTGNTVVDALMAVVRRIRTESALRSLMDREFEFLNHKKRLLLVTGHRRENFGEGFAGICDAMLALASRPDVEIVYPVHLNPNVQEPVLRLLGGHPNVHLMEPQEYLQFVYLMERAYLVLTDSGGVQEEAPSLGKPVLVLRETTERPEAVEAGTVRLVGTDPSTIMAAASDLLDDASVYNAMSQAHNPYGNGTASEQITAVLKTLYHSGPALGEQDTNHR